MKHLLPSAAGLLLLTLPCQSPGAESNPFGIQVELDAAIQNGLHELYNLNFEKAENIFEPLQNQADDHPMVALGMATVYWWELSVNVLENEAASSEPFLTAAEKCQKTALRKVKAGDPTGEAHVVLGSIYALLARWKASNRAWMSVFQNEKLARYYLEQALSINAQAFDAYMALGIFDYTLAKLPRIVRFLSSSQAGGDPEKGIEELILASEQGRYLRLPATFFLATIYANHLNDPGKNLSILTTLRQEYPQSPFVDLMMITAFYNQNCGPELAFEAAAYESRVSTGLYRSEFWPQAHFFQALVAFKNKDWASATDRFDKAIQTAAEKNPFKIWSLLYKGYALDALSRREEALACYRLVLSERPRWQSHGYAEKRLKTPFSAGDEEWKTLLL